MTTLIVPEYKLDTLMPKIQRIIRKCQKAGIKYICDIYPPYMQEVEVNYINKEDHECYIKTENIRCVKVDLDLRYSIDGWSVLGVVKDKGDIRQTYFKDASLCPLYKNTELNYCDHCHTHRKRQCIVILENTEGEIKKVGSSCCQAYTRGIDGALCSEWCAVYNDVVSMSIDVNEHYDEDIEVYWRKIKDRPVTLAFVMILLAYLIENKGYISRSKAQIMSGPSTADMAYTLIDDVLTTICDTSLKENEEWESFFDNEKLKKIIPITQENIATALNAIKWCSELTDQQCTSSYLYNLRELSRVKLLLKYSENLGMLASLIPTYLQYKNEKAKEEQKEKGEYLNEVGDRIECEAILQEHKTYQAINYSYYGNDDITKYIYLFNYQNNLLVWFTTKRLNITDGTKIKLRGTVKEHSMFNGTKQTVLTRCKVTSI